MSTNTIAPSTSNKDASTSESSVNLSFQFNDSAILITSIVVALIIIACILGLIYSIHKQRKLQQISHSYRNNHEELRRSEIINWVKHDDGKFFTLSLIDVPVPDDSKETLVLKISYQCDRVGDLIGNLIITEKSVMDHINKSKCIIPVSNPQPSSKFKELDGANNDDDDELDKHVDNDSNENDDMNKNKTYCKVYSRKYLQHVELKKQQSNKHTSDNHHSDDEYSSDGRNYEGNYEASCGSGQYSRRHSKGHVNNMSSNKNGIDNYFTLSNKGNNNFDSIKRPCYSKDEYDDDHYNSDDDDDNIDAGFSDSDEDNSGFINDYYAR